MIRILQGDCRDVLRTLERGSISACVTDPPYELGFMGRAWDQTGVAFRPEMWRLVFDVMKPGAHMVAFGGTRTYHRIACAIEDAGFEIRDTLCWLYGAGFPKSHDVSKGIDKAAGAERTEVVGEHPYANRGSAQSSQAVNLSGSPKRELVVLAPATPDAIRWQGWGTALKPAFEPIILARRPLIGTVVANVLQHGTGAINIDACRVGTDETITATRNIALGSSVSGVYGAADVPGVYQQQPGGRWPANVLHDGSEEVEAAFAAFGEKTTNPAYGTIHSGAIWGAAGAHPVTIAASTGTASRFFYSSKADKGDRADSRHPTVKPVDLMRWLVRLVTPPGGTILDPFAGSGTTGEAAMLEGFDCIMIERDPQSVVDIRHRIKRWSGEDTPLFAEVAAE